MSVRSLEESLHNQGLSRSRRSLDDSLGSIVFDRLEIREYPIQVGDNPSVSGGVPLTIGWEYDKDATAVLNVEEYEENRPPRRSMQDMAVPKKLRNKMLIESGHSRSEVTQAVRTTIRDKNSRRRTINNLHLQAYEEVREKATRGVRRFMFRKKKSSALYEEWKKNESARSDAERKRAEAAIREENEAAAREEDLVRRRLEADTNLSLSTQSAPPRILIEEDDSDDEHNISTTLESHRATAA